MRTELQWAAFSDVLRTPEVLALIYEQVMYLFPKRAFTPEQWEEFNRQIDQRVTLSS